MIPNIYLYVDYRQYVNDLFCAFYFANNRLSPRGFGRWLGWRNADFMVDLIDRKIDLDPSTISLLAKRLDFNEKQREYLETIVSFDQAKSNIDKDKYFRKIIYSREYGSVKELEQQQYDYFSHWYNPVVRELVIHEKFNGDPGWIAERIVPSISRSKVVESIKLLESLGMIQIDNGGKKWVQSEKVVSTPSEVISAALLQYHESMSKLGLKALERFGADVRDVRSVTMGIPKSSYAHIKKRMEDLWKEMLQYAITQDQVEVVYQLNLQLFPLSKEDTEEQ